MVSSLLNLNSLPIPLTFIAIVVLLFLCWLKNFSLLLYPPLASRRLRKPVCFAAWLCSICYTAVAQVLHGFAAKSASPIDGAKVGRPHCASQISRQLFLLKTKKHALHRYSVTVPAKPFAYPKNRPKYKIHFDIWDYQFPKL